MKELIASPVNTPSLFVKRFERPSDKQWNDMIAWCKETLYHGGHYEPKWGVAWPSFYFTDEKEYALFLLRWS